MSSRPLLAVKHFCSDRYRINTMVERGRPRSFDRDAALASAMDVFWTKGYEGASLAELIGAMGIASTSLYAAFGSKEALFHEAVELYAATEGGDIWRAVERAASAYEAVQAFLMETARVFTRSGRPTGCLVVLSALHATESSDTVRRELIRLRAKTVDDLLERLQRGVASGELSADVDLKAVASYYVTVQQGMSIQARDGANRKTLQGIARAALTAWGPLTSVVNPQPLTPP